MNICPQCRKHTPDGYTASSYQTCPECQLLNATLEHNKRQEAQQRKIFRMQQDAAAAAAQARYPSPPSQPGEPTDLEALMICGVGVVAFVIAWVFLPEGWPGWVRVTISGAFAILGGVLARIIMIAVLGLSLLVGAILLYGAYKRSAEAPAAAQGSAPVAEQRPATDKAQTNPPPQAPAVSDRR